MTTLRIVYQVIFFIPRFIKAFKFMITGFPDLVIKGEVSIVTPFQYRDVDKKYAFQTIIQLDADIINFIPDPELFGNDTEWKKLYNDNYQAHLDRVNETIAKFEGISTVTLVLSAVLSIFSVLLIQEHISLFESETIFLIKFVFLFILTFVFQRILSRYLFKQFLLILAIQARKRMIRKKVWC